MSQALLIRVEALEKRVAELESHLMPDDSFQPRHFGKGRWQVVKDGVKVGTEWLAKEDAEKLADELNAATEGTA